MKIIEFDINKVIPYKNNPRNNDNAVNKVAESIKQFGFKQPIVVDSNYTVIVGHTRLRAAKKLNYKKVPIIIADDLTDDKIKAYRLADNKTSEFATWDMDLLSSELEELKYFDCDFDMPDFGFDLNFNIEENENSFNHNNNYNDNDYYDVNNENNNNDSNSNNSNNSINSNNNDDNRNNNNNDNELLKNKYTKNIDIPNYEPKTETAPKIIELIDIEKTNKLIEKIYKSNLNEELKNFLKHASYRHLKFNYHLIAEYYAHADKEAQELFEDSALVIIDYKKAIENGFVEINRKLLEEMENTND